MYSDIRKFTGKPTVHLPQQNQKTHTRSCLDSMNRSLFFIIHYSPFQELNFLACPIRFSLIKRQELWWNSLCLQQKCRQKRAENAEVLLNYRYLSLSIWSIHQEGTTVLISALRIFPQSNRTAGVTTQIIQKEYEITL